MIAIMKTFLRLNPTCRDVLAFLLCDPLSFPSPPFSLCISQIRLLLHGGDREGMFHGSDREGMLPVARNVSQGGYTECKGQ